MKVRDYFRHPGWDETQTWPDQLRDGAGEAKMPDHPEPAAWKGSQPAPAPQGEPLAPRHRRPPALRLPQPRSEALIEQARRPGRPAGRAVIGDQLRLPVVWCQMGSCIARHFEPQALGEADIRARAIAAGWRVDALGRLACPGGQQTSPHFWPARAVVARDRDAATAGAPRLAAASRDSQRPGGRTRAGAAPLAALPARVQAWGGLRTRGRDPR